MHVQIDTNQLSDPQLEYLGKLTTIHPLRALYSLGRIFQPALS